MTMTDRPLVTRRLVIILADVVAMGLVLIYDSGWGTEARYLSLGQ